MNSSNKGRFTLSATNMYYPSGNEVRIDRRGYNAIFVKGKVNNAAVTMKFVSEPEFSKLLQPIPGSNIINDTYPFPAGDNKGYVEFEATAINPSNQVFLADLEYELIILDDKEYETQLGKVYQFEKSADADIFSPPK